jgi:2-oxoglutarate ferredoxin oxidoreductase subunit beta
MVESPHGRAAAVATGIKRVRPDNLVFSYQGDGDLAAIGTAETFHAANRGELVTAIFVNNAVYGMTGGQMAPTSLVGQKTTTSPLGRNPLQDGYPLKFSEVLAFLGGSSYLERVAVNSPANIKKAKKAIAKAFQHQLKKSGFSMVEILSPCPINWGMSPVESCKWIDEVMSKEYPLGVIKEKKC